MFGYNFLILWFSTLNALFLSICPFSSFFILFPFFPSDWVSSSHQPVWSQIFFFCLSLLLKFSVAFVASFLVFFSSRISFLVISVCSCFVSHVSLISLSRLSVLPCSLLSFIKQLLCVLCQVVCRSPFLWAGYWSFINIFLWWSHVYLILADLCKLVWMSLYLKEQTPAPVCRGCFWQVKTFSYWTPGLMGASRIMVGL